MITVENEQRERRFVLGEVMDAKGVRVVDLAVKLGVGSTNVSNWKTGRSRPHADMLPKIAQVLGVGLDDLYE